MGEFCGHIVLVAINAKFVHASLSVRSLRAYAGSFIKLREFTINEPEELIESELYAMQPGLLAFSCYIWNIEMVLRIVRTLRKILPEVKIVLGGPEVLASDELSDIADALVIGEGEGAFAKLLEDYKAGQQLQRVYHGKEYPLALEEIPFAYDNFDKPILYYESSRGCANSCAYCLAPSSVRFLPMKRVREDLNKFLQAEVKQVKFVDRTFNCAREHAMGIWDFLIKRDNGKTNFHFELAGELLDEEMISLIAKARKGLFQFEIGVQSTNPKTIQAIQRRTDIEKLLENVRKLKKAGNVHLHLDLIAGLPHEDWGSITESFNTVMDCRPDHMQLGFLKLLRGSKLREEAKKYKIIYKDEPPYEILSNDCLGYAQINRLKMMAKMLRLFYNSGNFCLEEQLSRFDSPFAFFDGLAAYWEENDYHLVSHKRSTLQRILDEFCSSLECKSE